MSDKRCDLMSDGWVQLIREELKSRNAPREGDFIGGVRRRMKSAAMHVNHRPNHPMNQRNDRTDWMRFEKYCPICPSEIAKLNDRDSASIFDR